MSLLYYDFVYFNDLFGYIIDFIAYMLNVFVHVVDFIAYMLSQILVLR